MAPRRQGVEYDVEPAGDRLLIVHNDGAPDFELAEAPLDATSHEQWTPVLPHTARRADHSACHAYAGHAVVLAAPRRADRAARAAPLDAPATWPRGRDIAFDEPLFTVDAVGGPEYVTDTIRLGYESMVTPAIGLRLRARHRRAHSCASRRRCSPGRTAPVPPGGLRAGARLGRPPRTAPGSRSRSSGAPTCRWTGPRRRLLYGYGSYEISDRPELLHPAAVPAGPRLRLRHRPHPRRRRDGPELVRERQDADQEEHLHRLRRRAPTTWSSSGYTSPDRLAAPRGQRRRAADGRGGQPGARSGSGPSTPRCRSWTR